MRAKLAAIGLLLPLALTACLPSSKGPAVQNGTELSRQIATAATEGRALRIADHTDFAWDAVSFVTEGTKAEEIERRFGERIIKEARFTSAANLLVFSEGGSVVNAQTVTADPFRAADSQRSYGREATLTPVEGRPGYLAWTD